jgi:hypothetical protein
MTTDQYVAVFSAAISFFGLLLVVIQLRDSNEQRKIESQICLYDINRELISLGFSNPQLFEILKDAKNVDPAFEQRYLQMWLNQLSLVHSFKKNGIFQKDVEESFDTDLRDIVTMSNMRRHWRKFGKYYPASFQKSVNDILDKAGLNQTDKEPATN